MSQVSHIYPKCLIYTQCPKCARVPNVPNGLYVPNVPCVSNGPLCPKSPNCPKFSKWPMCPKCPMCPICPKCLMCPKYPKCPMCPKYLMFPKFSMCHSLWMPLCTQRWGHVGLLLSAQCVLSVCLSHSFLSVCPALSIVQAVKHETLTQCWANVGPLPTLSQLLVQSIMPVPTAWSTN